MRYFLFKSCIPGIEILTTRIFTKIKPNEIFNDFAISGDTINEMNPVFFCFKDKDYKITPDPVGPARTKFAEVDVG